MVRGMLLIRYGMCTCLGLIVIGLAAMASQADQAGRSEGSQPPLSGISF